VAIGIIMLIAISLRLAGCSREPVAHAPGITASSAPAPASTPAQPQTHIIVTDETGGRIVMIDAATGAIVDTVAVGKRPRGLRALRDGSHVLVALSGSPIAGPGVDESKLPPADRDADGVGVVDLATHKVVRTIKSGQDPETFALSPDEQTLYVSNEETAEMSVVDIAKGEVRARAKACELRLSRYPRPTSRRFLRSTRTAFARRATARTSPDPVRS